MASDVAFAGMAAPEPATLRLPSRTAPSTVPHDPWVTYKPIIEHLYIVEGKPLREVMQFMEREHGFRSTAKSYKRRLKSWGLTKYIKLQAEVDGTAVKEVISDGALAVATRKWHGYVQLANGQLVDAESLAMHLRRKARAKNAAQWKRRYEVLPPGAAIRAPDRFRVLEGIYVHVRAYTMGRFEDTITTPKEADLVRGWNPHSGRWLQFSAAVRAACEEGRMNEAIFLMRRAPEELGLLLRHQPSNTLNNFFRFLAQSIRFIDYQDPAGSQFLKVVKALIQFGVAHLTQNAASLGLSATHPLYRLFDCLAKVDEHELLQAAWKGWKAGCDSWYDIMKEPEAWSANVDYLNIARLGGCSVNELPANMGDILDKTVKRYEAEGTSNPKYLASLWNSAVYTELVSSGSVGGVSPESDLTGTTADPRGLVTNAGIVGPGAPIHVRNSSDPRRSLDKVIESMRQTALVLQEEYGKDSPLALRFVREADYGLTDAGAMEAAAEMAKLAE